MCAAWINFLNPPIEDINSPLDAVSLKLGALILLPP